MAQTLTAGPGKRAGREQLFDIHPQTGAAVEVFYADRSLETFGRGGAGCSGGLAVAALRLQVRRLGLSLRATQRIGTRCVR